MFMHKCIAGMWIVHWMTILDKNKLYNVNHVLIIYQAWLFLISNQVFFSWKCNESPKWRRGSCGLMRSPLSQYCNYSYSNYNLETTECDITDALFDYNLLMVLIKVRSNSVEFSYIYWYLKSFVFQYKTFSKQFWWKFCR